MATQHCNTPKANSIRIVQVVEADSINDSDRLGEPGLNDRISDAIEDMEKYGDEIDLVDVRVTTTFNPNTDGFRHVATIIADCTPNREAGQ